MNTISQMQRPYVTGQENLYELEVRRSYQDVLENALAKLNQENTSNYKIGQETPLVKCPSYPRIKSKTPFFNITYKETP